MSTENNLEMEYDLIMNFRGLPPPVVDMIVVDPSTQKILPPGHKGELWMQVLYVFNFFSYNLFQYYQQGSKSYERILERPRLFIISRLKVRQCL